MGDATPVRLARHRQGAGAGWTTLPADDWNRLAAQYEPIGLRVTGMIESDPDLACRSTAQQVFVTDQALAGSVFYANVEGIMRVDAAHPSVGTTAAFPAASSAESAEARPDPAEWSVRRVPAYREAPGSPRRVRHGRATDSDPPDTRSISNQRRRPAPSRWAR